MSNRNKIKKTHCFRFNEVDNFIGKNKKRQTIETVFGLSWKARRERRFFLLFRQETHDAVVTFYTEINETIICFSPFNNIAEIKLNNISLVSWLKIKNEEEATTKIIY